MGTLGQWLVKPALGVLLATTVVPWLGLPHAVGTGLILVRRSALGQMLALPSPIHSHAFMKAANPLIRGQAAAPLWPDRVFMCTPFNALQCLALPAACAAQVARRSGAQLSS